MHTQKFKLHISNFFLMCVVSILFAIIAMTLLLAIPLFIKIFCCALTLIIGYRLLCFVLLQHSFAIIALQYVRDNHWLIETKNGIFTAKLCEDSVVTHFVSVLRMQLIGDSRVMLCVIFRDALAKTKYQTLLMLLYLFNAEPDVVFLDHQSPQK